MARRLQDNELLRMALKGYETQKASLEQGIQDLQKRLFLNRPALIPSPIKKHKISPEGRARIAAAQRKRWAIVKRQKVTS